jgi:NTP pyrophosphatase (non-canonical NTP hydrolase)
MKILEAQEKIKVFDKIRGWDNRWDIKDLCLNINEEIGELWNLIKWISESEQKKVIAANKNLAIDFIGDMLFLILKISNQLKVDATKALNDTLAEYEKRMPPEIMKKTGHANKYAGGHDDKKSLTSG